MLYTLQYLLISSIFLVLSIVTKTSESDSKYKRVTVQTAQGSIQLEYTKKALMQFEMLKDMLEDCCNGSEIILNCNEKQITLYSVRNLLLQAEDLTKDRLFDISFHNSIGLMQLAEKLGACDALKNMIAKLHYDDHVYNILLHDAELGKINLEESDFEVNSARDWLIRCIPTASDTKKIEIRKILYPLQYTSPTFTALIKTVHTSMSPRKINQKTFCQLQEFKDWSSSFEHKAYCAAKLSSSLSCSEFYDLKKIYTIKPEALAFCHNCKQTTQQKKNNCACHSCMKQILGMKKVDLSDCYNLDTLSLYRIIHYNYSYYTSGGCGHVNKNISECEEYLEHLPQIHLPLLALLIKHEIYNESNPYFRTSFYFKFGTSAVELHSVDINALQLLLEQGNNKKNLVRFTFDIKTKQVAETLKPELIKLKIDNRRIFIKFYAPDADTKYKASEVEYKPILKKDKWMINAFQPFIKFTIFSAALIIGVNFFKKKKNFFLKKLNNFEEITDFLLVYPFLCGCTCVGIRKIFNSIDAMSWEPGILKSILKLLGLIKPEYEDIAYYMKIVHSKFVYNYDE